jgi:hypothetical protein
MSVLRTVLSRLLKVAREGADVTLGGRSFHARAAALETLGHRLSRARLESWKLDVLDDRACNQPILSHSLLRMRIERSVVFCAYSIIYPLSCSPSCNKWMNKCINMFIQVQYSPKRITGLGRVDGEAVERFWSFARHYAPMTKEMTPSHRIDLLTDGFLYYGNRKKENLGKYYYIFLTDRCKCYTNAVQSVRFSKRCTVHR